MVGVFESVNSELPIAEFCGICIEQHKFLLELRGDCEAVLDWRSVDSHNVLQKYFYHLFSSLIRD